MSIVAIILAAIAFPAGQVGATDSPQDSGPLWASTPYLEFPSQAIGQTDEGHVSLSCVVGIDGRTKSCDVDQENPEGFGFGDAARNAAPEFRFLPAIRDGVTVEETAHFNLVFKSGNPPPQTDGGRVTDQQQRAFGVVDRLGFHSGLCSDRLTTKRRTELEAGLTSLAGGARLPVFDQVLFGAYGRGRAAASDQALTEEYCESALSSAQRAADDSADLIAEVEQQFPPAGRRSAH